jgi:hypothetical protein
MRKGHSVQWNGFGCNSLIKVSLSSARDAYRLGVVTFCEAVARSSCCFRSLSLRLDLSSLSWGGAVSAAALAAAQAKIILVSFIFVR